MSQQNRINKNSTPMVGEPGIWAVSPTHHHQKCGFLPPALPTRNDYPACRPLAGNSF